MTKILIGALLGLLLVCPAALTVVGATLTVIATVAAVLLSKPVLVAFALGLAVRLPRIRRWAR